MARYNDPKTGKTVEAANRKEALEAFKPKPKPKPKKAEKEEKKDK
jgi:hypothetical protein